MTESLLSLSADELTQRVVALGGKRFHAKAIRAAVLQQGVLDYAQMTSIPASVRVALGELLPILAGTEIDQYRTKDGTTKILTSFARQAPGKQAPDGQTANLSVETVHIPPIRRDTDADEAPGTMPPGATLCVSSQAGCPVGCPFCASGLLGLARNLEAHEIVEQFVRGRAVGPLRRAVVMGIGEPLLNIVNLTEALDTVRDNFDLGARKITVSTVGFPDRLRRLAPTRPGFQLAISLHTPDQEQRDALVPAMKGVPIEDILAAGDHWFAQTGREVTYEYVLLGGENDSEGHAVRLAERLARRRCSVNIIPYNPSPELPYARPSEGSAGHFRDILVAEGTVATIRWSRGLDGAAACGQLRLA